MLAIINKNVYTLHFLLHYILSLSTLYHDSGILGEGGYPPKFFVEECVPNLETCTLFQTEICDLLRIHKTTVTQNCHGKKNNLTAKEITSRQKE